MATMNTKSPKRIQWMWNANDDPFAQSESIEWQPYSDVENMIIEEAFQAGKTHVLLDSYSIDFKNKIQILDADHNKQRPITRVIHDKNNAPLRADRFTYTAINAERPFADQYGWISPFIRATVKYLNITKDHLPSKDATVVPMIVEKAAAGIIIEGRKIGKRHEAEKIAEKLREKRHCGIQEVWKCCAKLYTMDSFLYRRLNETMRLIGDKNHEQRWREQARTLGPFCLLLWDNPFSDETATRGKILYRGATLSNEQIEIFKKDCFKKDKIIRSFQSFTSCSRDQDFAKQFGNVLFIMTVKHAFSANIKEYSEYPYEEEELVSPGVCFTVEHVQFNQKSRKHEIYLNLIQQFSRKLI